MNIKQRKSVYQLAAGLVLSGLLSGAHAETAAELHRDAKEALQLLYSTNEVAADFGEIGKAILVFPNIVKAGLVFGGAYGEGILLQAGAQSYGYAVFLMTDAALQYLQDSDGWEIGVGPKLVVMDEGVATNVSSTFIQDDAYAFIFNQQGLMAGVSVERTKISHIVP